MHTCWSEMLIEEQRVILVKEGGAFQISPEHEGQLTIPELKFHQEETDSQMTLYCNYAEYQYARARTLIVISSGFFCVMPDI